MKVYTRVEDYKNVNNPIATIGTFDGVHIGHQKIINRLREIAKEEQGEVVLLTFFPHPRMVLQPDNDLQLIHTQQEKIAALEAAGVDHLIIYPFTKEFSRMTSVEYVRDLLVNKIQVKRLVIGYDHQFGRNREGNFEQLLEFSQIYGFEVEEISAQTIDDVNVSSTKIRKALQGGDIETANHYLAHPFSLSGTVVEGERVGRSIGFPTANIQTDEMYKLVPGIGVYAVRVEHREKTYQGMLNIGVKPTLGEAASRSIEVNIFDFDQDIYSETLKIEFVKRIRDEQKFDSLEALKSALEADKRKTIEILEKHQNSKTTASN